MSSPDRQELVQNAVAFLADPKTQASPLAQRIQFLEAKGLNPQEIDTALKQATSNNSGPSYQQNYPPGYGAYHLGAPPSQLWDWRDYFVPANFKHLLPHLQPPTSTAYEEDREALNAQFDAAEALLKEIQSESAAVRKAVEEQKEVIDRTTANVETVVVEMREAQHKTRDEMREIRDEVNNIREMLPKMINKNKESQTQSLSELQQELKSLKALLLSRGPSSIPSSPLPALGRPSIPAWQLAGTSSQNGIETSSSTPSIPVGDVKEKEPEPADNSP
ncbi:hypothetical protein C0989_002237 [Termitomyces sp. Mn162]|nr:hypothetical protein C0989_002237 [Termitomyces sp. Mn162]